MESNYDDYVESSLKCIEAVAKTFSDKSATIKMDALKDLAKHFKTWEPNLKKNQVSAFSALDKITNYLSRVGFIKPPPVISCFNEINPEEYFAKEYIFSTTEAAKQFVKLNVPAFQELRKRTKTETKNLISEKNQEEFIVTLVGREFIVNKQTRAIRLQKIDYVLLISLYETCLEKADDIVEEYMEILKINGLYDSKFVAKEFIFYLALEFDKAEEELPKRLAHPLMEFYVSKNTETTCTPVDHEMLSREKQHVLKILEDVYKVQEPMVTRVKKNVVIPPSPQGGGKSQGGGKGIQEQMDSPISEPKVTRSENVETHTRDKPVEVLPPARSTAGPAIPPPTAAISNAGPAIPPPTAATSNAQESLKSMLDSASDTKSALDGKAKELYAKIQILNKQLTNAQIDANKNRSKSKEVKENLEKEIAEHKVEYEKLTKQYDQLQLDLRGERRKVVEALEKCATTKRMADISIQQSEKAKGEAAIAQKEAHNMKQRAKEIQASAEDAKAQNILFQQQLDILKREKIQLEKDFLREQRVRKQLHNELEDMKGKIRVIARVRPMSKSEGERGCAEAVEVASVDSLVVVDKNRSHVFEFDSVFGPEADQGKVFSGPKRLIQSVVDGFNVCIFAYGQTGSGKTWTMTGDMSQEALHGITPRAIDELFRILERDEAKYTSTMTMNMLELYKNDLIDLLLTKEKLKNPPKLKVRRNPMNGHVTVDEATFIDINSKETLYTTLQRGFKRRKTASTKMNAESSRSHLLQIIHLECTNSRTGVISKGKLTLVDLAGSERAGKTGSSGDTLKEAMSINKSLSALGDVIGALTSGAKHVPYRNHCLTELMSDSIGGSAKTLMFVNISPADYNSNESKSSLQFGSRCRTITNSVKSSKSSSNQNDNSQITSLRSELQRLKSGKGGIKPKNVPTKLGTASPINRMHPGGKPMFSASGDLRAPGGGIKSRKK